MWWRNRPHCKGCEYSVMRKEIDRGKWTTSFFMCVHPARLTSEIPLLYDCKGDNFEKRVTPPKFMMNLRGSNRLYVAQELKEHSFVCEKCGNKVRVLLMCEKI